MVKKLMVLLLLASSLSGAFLIPKAQALSSSLLMAKVQTGSAASATEEFVEIVNVAPVAVDVTGWRVEYLSAAGNVSSPALAVLVGDIGPGAFVVLARTGYMPDAAIHFSNGLNDAGGHIRIRDKSGVTIDMLGWGTATQPETLAAPTPIRGEQLVRKTYVDTDNNAADFVLGGPSGILSADAPATDSSCEGVTISEVLPNPAGTDKGHEFIELHNPTEAQAQLSGCNIAVGNKSFALPLAAMEPGEYRAFYDSQTGLTLPNAAGGGVTLATPTAEVVLQYPATLGDNEVWANVNGVWQVSNVPTPAAPNQSSQATAKTTAEDTELNVCPAGKYRNPATNRCKALETDSAPSPCKVGQVRSPSTNRCVSALTASASLSPCKAGQERNPATNRCRSVLSAASSLKPCDEGEQRNPETNRCRKSSSLANASPKAADVAKKGSDKVSYGVVGGVAAIAFGYAIYEYRLDFRNRLATIKTRLFPGQMGK